MGTILLFLVLERVPGLLLVVLPLWLKGSNLKREPEAVEAFLPQPTSN